MKLVTMGRKKNTSLVSQLFQLIVVVAVIGGLVYLFKRIWNNEGVEKDSDDKEKTL